MDAMGTLRRGKFVTGLIAAAIVLCMLAEVMAQVSVRGYTRKDGTYVSPHYRSAPDGNFNNNWSTSGNVNPYTGRVGTRVSPPSDYGSDVYVGGYSRSDGTYVSPHYRSTPDGNFDNNWSTSGNANPYTGRAGTRQTPPAGYGVSNAQQSLEQLDTSVRQNIANRLRQQGYNVNWADYSFSELNDMSVRISVADRLIRQGYNVNWQDHSFSELNDMSVRISMADRLRQRGNNVNWEDYSFSQLLEMSAR